MAIDIRKRNIPPHPGVYLMKDSHDKIIYIGKAKNLGNRVRSYFAGSQNYKTQVLVSKMADIEFVLTDTEDEAFLLESNLIKRYRPPYNIELKDQQRYTYLRITDEKYPRLMVARRMRTGKFLGKGRIYGPFVRGSSKLLSVGMLRKHFQIRICKTLPKKACLEYHLGNCEAPCEFASAQKKYAGHVGELESVLKGKDQMREFAEKLKGEMTRASDSLDFERAIQIRDTLGRLDSLGGGQKMERIAGGQDEDYFGIRAWDQRAYIMSLKQANGVIRDRERFEFDIMADNTFSSFLYQYYTTQKIPRNIILSSLPENAQSLKRALAKRAGYEVDIMVPQRGRRRRLVDLILKNIDLIQSTGAEPAILGLQKELKLSSPPHIIECFDISNHGTDYAVGAMSRMIEGQPAKSGYRKFKIKTVKGQDDYSMISEIVKRRYLRLSEEGEQMPDLILIDGGKGQLRAALSSLHSLALDIECASLAKRDEEVYVPGRGEPILLLHTSEELKILQRARDEAHRFGLEYNRRLRRIKRSL